MKIGTARHHVAPRASALEQKHTGRFDSAKIDQYFAKGKDVTFFGKMVTDMTKDQLIAAIGCAMEELQSMRERHRRDLAALRELSGISPVQRKRTKSLRERVVAGGIIDST